MGESRAVVIGVGSPHGDDQFGWEVVSRLRAELPDDVQAIAVDDPLAIADIPVGCKLLVIVDACRGIGFAGNISQFAWPDSRLAAMPATSSHGIGLVDALELAAALGKLPSRVVVLAAEAESAEPGRGLSLAIAAAVPEVVARVLAEITVTRPTTG